MACCNDGDYGDYIYSLGPMSQGLPEPLSTILGLLFIGGLAYGLWWGWNN